MWLLQITENYANHRNYVLFGENVKFSRMLKVEHQTIHGLQLYQCKLILHKDNVKRMVNSKKKLLG